MGNVTVKAVGEADSSHPKPRARNGCGAFGLGVGFTSCGGVER